MRTHSSAGRAPLLQSGGPWFDPKCVYHSCDVSSVDQSSGFDPGGRRFNSCTPHQFSAPVQLSQPRPRSTHSDKFRSIVLGSRPMAGLRTLTPRNVGFEPYLPSQPVSMVALAQSARAPGCELGGCGFEPRTSPHNHSFSSSSAGRALRWAKRPRVRVAPRDQSQWPLSSTWLEHSTDNREVLVRIQQRLPTFSSGL